MLRISLILLTVLVCSFAQAQVTKHVRGTLNDIKTQKPINKADLIIHNLDSTKIYEARTNSLGQFDFENIPFGSYKLVVADRTYNQISIPFELTEVHADNYTFDSFEVGRKVSWMLDWGDTPEQEHYWSHFVSKIILFIYFICLVLVLFYAILQLTLAISYVRHRKDKENQKKPVYDPNNTPKVTVQLPMFNELYVADRIIETVANFDYPADKLQIQVLDDSTDETKKLLKLQPEVLIFNTFTV